MLIVEDESILALVLRRVLEKEGYEITAVLGYGEEVTEAIEEHRPHIVLMDIFLKGTMNGVEATKAINEKYQLPVIYITGNTDEATYNDAMKTEPFAYLEKPVHLGELRVLIKEALADTR